MPRYLLNKTYLGLEVGARLLVLVATLIFRACYEPFTRRIQGSDWSNYAYPYEKQQMFSELTATLLLVFISVGALLIGVVLLRYKGKWDWSGIAEEVTTYVLGITLSGLFGWLICELIKRLYGRPRPDFLARCFMSNDPNQWFEDHNWTSLDQIPEIPDCGHYYSDDKHFFVGYKQLLDGRMSFPSAHTTLSFAWIGFVALWGYSKLCLFRNIGSWRLVIPFAIMTVPTAVAVSRTSDYRHHPSDVIAGVIIGSGIAWICCAFYFPLEMKPAAQAIYDRRRVRQLRERFSYRDAVRLPQEEQISLSDIEAQNNNNKDSPPPKGASAIPSTVA